MFIIVGHALVFALISEDRGLIPPDQLTKRLHTEVRRNWYRFRLGNIGRERLSSVADTGGLAE